MTFRSRFYTIDGKTVSREDANKAFHATLRANPKASLVTNRKGVIELVQWSADFSSVKNIFRAEPAR